MIALSSIMITLLVAQADAAAPVRQAKSQAVDLDPPAIQVGLFSYRPDGTVQGSAVDTGLSLAESVQYVSACGLTSGNRPVPDGATDAWRISGRILSTSAEEAVIKLDWQRIRAGGVAVNSPGASVQLTLQSGDRVPLDSVNVDGTDGCPSRTVGFEARYGPRGLSMSPGGGGRGTGGGGARAGSSGAGGSATVSGSGGFGVGRSVRPPGDSIADRPDSPRFAVDLWLVHNAPGRNEDAIQQVLTGVRGSAQFAFPPVTIDTAQTSVNLQVTGIVRFMTDDAGVKQMVFITMRNAKFSRIAGSVRDALTSVQGASTTTHPMPGPDEVLSFELPPLRLPNGPAIPDQFSVRVRIR
jgi:hypothetical protein